MDYRLEVVVIPVSDVDRSKAFYEEGLGFHVDVDQQMPGMRIVQLTAPGSACSVTIGPKLVEPGERLGNSASLQFCVTDVAAAREELLGRGVEVGDVQVLAPGDGGSFLFFTDPDGNDLAIQQWIGSATAEPGSSE